MSDQEDLYGFDKRSVQAIGRDHERLRGTRYESPGQAGAPGSIGSASPIRWLRALNSTSPTEAAPPYAIMQVLDTPTVDGVVNLSLQKFDGSAGASFAIASRKGIALADSGAATRDFPIEVLFDPGTGTPTPGAEWGPVAGSYAISAAGKGYVVLGVTDPANNLAEVIERASLAATAIVKIDESAGIADGLQVMASAAGLWQGLIQTIDPAATAFGFGASPAPFVNSSSVWLIVLDEPNGSATPNATLTKGDRFVAMDCKQTLTVGSDTRPLYAIDKRQGLVRCQLFNALTPGGSCTGKLIYYNAGAWTTYGNFVNIDGKLGNWCGAAGQNCWCRPRVGDRTTAYEIVWMDMSARFIEATSVANYSAFAANCAVNNKWDGTDPALDGAGHLLIHDRQQLFKRHLSGGKIKGTWDPFVQQYEMLAAETQAGLIEFTISGAFASLGSGVSEANATVVYYTGTQIDTQQPIGTIKVRDMRNRWASAPVGAKGLAVYDSLLDVYWIVICELPATKYESTLTANLTRFAAPAVNTGTYGILSSFPYTLAPSFASAIGNPYQLTGKTGDSILVDAGRAVQVTHHPISLTLDVQVSGGVTQKKFKTFQLMDDGSADSGWVNA